MRKPAIYKDYHYHIYNRGVSQQNIFKNEIDFRYFMYRIAYYKIKYQIEIVVCCIMPNHYHLLLKSPLGAINIYKFMQGLQLTYAKYFNRTYTHKGHVFESKYHHKAVKTAKSLANVINYIRQNPVKKRLVSAAEEWPYLI